MASDGSTYRIVNRDGKPVRVLNRRSLAGWLAYWLPRGWPPAHYRIERAVIFRWDDVTEEFMRG